MNIIYAPSLMSADMLHLADDLAVLDKYAGIYHVDMMDTHFAKNLALSPNFIKSVKSVSNVPVEAHFMFSEPDTMLDTVIESGADIITLHIETIGNAAFRMINKIKSAGRKVGMVLCPATPLESIKYIAREIDILTIMTVDIGYAGQKFIDAMLPKIKEAAKLKQDNNCKYIIQADGGISPENFKEIYDAGARAFVMGASALFIKGVPLKESCENLYKNYEAQINSTIV